MNKHYDYIIVGAGCSGLSLAVLMHQAGLLENKKLLMIDRRSNFNENKSWCGWNVKPHAFQVCVSKEWSNWQVSHQGRDVLQRSNQYSYQYVDAKDYYDYCLQYINNTSSIQMQLNTCVKNIEPQSVVCDQARLNATTIFDARAPNLKEKLQGNFLLQCFYGWFIETDQPVFDSQVTTLMDFPADQSKGINFIYLLPFSKNRALIEPTFFLNHQNIPSEDEFFQLATLYMRNKFQVERFRVTKKEQVILPMMGAPSSENNEGVVRIGSAYGLLRPATGYAFHGIQTAQSSHRESVATIKSSSFKTV